ncbi:MAG: lipoate--protein ligase family protein [Candidatus Aenigmarchaeota archaeon]|nr:lipoate--protein ligase family protein [Candidatus Aenigmarchaeota archaeon]
MALEEFLIRRIADQKLNDVAAIRFYSFPQDSIVLGYAQDTDVIKYLDSTVRLTRRITGGSHVQTGPNVISYSFVVPRDGSFKTYEDMRTFYADHVANALNGIGLDDVNVDNKASIIKVDGRPIAGHAMWWGIKSALLHGLITLTPYDVDKIADRVMLQQRKVGSQVYTEYSAIKNLPSVSDHLKAELDNRYLRELVGNAILREVTGNKYERKIVDDVIIQESIELFKQRYGKPLWINEHEPTFTEQEVEAIPGEELRGPLKKNLGYCLFIQVPDDDFKKMAQPTEV